MVLSKEARLSRDATNADVRPGAGGSRVDLEGLFEAHAAAMYRTILAYTGGRGDLAEEAVGEAFSRAAAHAAKLRDPVAWLYRVAFNVANDELRRERRDGVGVRDTVQEPPDLGEVLEALKRLPPRERAVMALFYVLDLPVREVAARLGIAAATVRVHLTRGRRHLGALLDDEEATRPMTARWERQLHRLREAPVPLERVRERAQQSPRPGSPLPPTRERVIAGVVAIAVFVAVAAFAWRAFTTAGEGTTPADAPPELPASPFSLWLSAERVTPGPVELVALLVNHDGSDATFGVLATVDRWDGREWVSYGELVMCMDHWHCTARVQSPGEIDAVPALGLSAESGRPGPVERFTTDGLDVGWYRISQEANEGTVAAAVFEIAEGAAVPAPLVSIDAPAISVTPALVPPDGAEIDLYPLIPAPTGAQSREDVLEAIRGLSEVAEIERWNGSTWEPAGEIQLREADDNLARSAELPPLPEGEYRLVRRGPEGPHIGLFWVDETT